MKEGSFNTMVDEVDKVLKIRGREINRGDYNPNHFIGRPANFNIPKIPSKSFYLVWRPGSHNPNFQHPTEEAATQEARRLCEKEGATFYILKTMGCFNPKKSIKPIFTNMV